MTKPITLLIGASSEIAKSVANLLVQQNNSKLVAVSRDCSSFQTPKFEGTDYIKLSDYSEENIEDACNQIASLSQHTTIDQVFIFHGILHSDKFMPEKRLEDFSADSFNQVLTANTLTPMLWLKYLTPLVTGKHQCKVTVFSARVGSIGDNRLGGWYSYRASKSALNMLLKSTAIELSRRAKNIKLISFHPGTTDTALSKPFQSNVPEGKLFSSQFVAKKLLKVTDKEPFDNQLSFIDWQGINIPW